MIEIKPEEKMTLKDLFIRAFLWGIEFTEEWNPKMPNADALLEERANFCADNLLEGRGREQVLEFAAAMEKRLRENEHRGDWKNGELDDLIAKAALAWENFTRAYFDGNYMRMIEQAPDCSNWPMILVDAAVHQGLALVSSVKVIDEEVGECRK